MSKFSRWVIPLNCRSIEPLYADQTIEYEEFPCTIDVIGSLLHTLFFALETKSSMVQQEEADEN